jgi:hypothetical protein
MAVWVGVCILAKRTRTRAGLAIGGSQGRSVEGRTSSCDSSVVEAVSGAVVSHGRGRSVWHKYTCKQRQRSERGGRSCRGSRLGSRWTIPVFGNCPFWELFRTFLLSARQTLMFEVGIRDDKYYVALVKLQVKFIFHAKATL